MLFANHVNPRLVKWSQRRASGWLWGPDMAPTVSAHLSRPCSGILALCGVLFAGPITNTRAYNSTTTFNNDYYTLSCCKSAHAYNISLVYNLATLHPSYKLLNHTINVLIIYSSEFNVPHHIA